MLLERIEWSDLPTPDHVGAGAGVPDWRLAPDATENNLTPATYDYTNGGAAIRVHRGRKEVQEFAALLASPVATVGAKLRAVLVWLQWSPEALVKARNLTRPDDPATVAKRAKAKAKKLEASVASASTPGAFAGAPTPGASAPSPRSESESAAAVRERSNDRGRDRGRRERERGIRWMRSCRDIWGQFLQDQIHQPPTAHRLGQSTGHVSRHNWHSKANRHNRHKTDKQ